MRDTPHVVNELLYAITKRAGFLPEAAHAVARRLNERIPYLPDRVFDEPLDERRIRAIARELDVTPKMSGDQTEALFEILARLSHADCLHSLELLVKRWDVNEELPVEFVADAIQPAFFAWWTRASRAEPHRVLEIAVANFREASAAALSTVLADHARTALRKVAPFVEENRAALAQELTRLPPADDARLFDGTPLRAEFSANLARTLVAAVDAAPEQRAEQVLLSDSIVVEVCKPWRGLSEPFVKRRSDELARLLPCPDLRRAITARAR